jgi:hypothetical protein
VMVLCNSYVFSFLLGYVLPIVMFMGGRKKKKAMSETHFLFIFKTILKTSFQCFLEQIFKIAPILIILCEH